MKTVLSAQQIAHYRRNGHVRFENFPFDFDVIKNLSKNTQRDLWRKEPSIKKMILQQLGPIALELTKKTALHLACDHWVESPFPSGRIQDQFCFQNLACIFVITPNNEECFIDVYEPSSLTSLVPSKAYLIVFAQENGVLIDNPKDPYTVQTRNLGYVYGDRLQNEFHPQIR